MAQAKSFMHPMPFSTLLKVTKEISNSSAFAALVTILWRGHVRRTAVVQLCSCAGHSQVSFSLSGASTNQHYWQYLLPSDGLSSATCIIRTTSSSSLVY